jgi:hypothetical protein
MVRLRRRGPVNEVARICFHKAPGTRYRSTLHRADGAVIGLEGGSWNRIGGPVGHIPHDLAHLVVDGPRALGRARRGRSGAERGVRRRPTAAACVHPRQGAPAGRRRGPQAGRDPGSGDRRRHPHRSAGRHGCAPARRRHSLVAPGTHHRRVRRARRASASGRTRMGPASRRRRHLPACGGRRRPAADGHLRAGGHAACHVGTASATLASALGEPLDERADAVQSSDSRPACSSCLGSPAPPMGPGAGDPVRLAAELLVMPPFGRVRARAGPCAACCRCLAGDATRILALPRIVQAWGHRPGDAASGTESRRGHSNP